jgi:ElaB/YqjD/DUF883 family membrane-anchored ribosome-binding protein
MNETAKEAAHGATGYRDEARLEKEMTAMKSDVARLSQQITDAVSAMSAAAQNRARHGLKRARVNVDRAVADASGAVSTAAQDAASSIGDTLEEAIEERPVTAIVMALGIGFLIGVRLRR